jgi:hypothetical protein
MVKAMELGGLVEKRISPLRSSQKARAASVEMMIFWFWAVWVVLVGRTNYDG